MYLDFGDFGVLSLIDNFPPLGARDVVGLARAVVPRVARDELDARRLRARNEFEQPLLLALQQKVPSGVSAKG